MVEWVEIGNAKLALGDCREILPALGRVDAVVTDPPYGVDFKGKFRHPHRRGEGKSATFVDRNYASYDDTPENFERCVVPAVSAAIAIASCGIVFMADKNIFRMPPGNIGGIYLPAGSGMTSWGFQNFMHAIFYGKCPYLASSRGSRPNGKYGLYGNDSNKVDHPCAKPVEAMEWAVERASLPGHTILDPFAGSGTTGVACARLGRPFIGIEIEPKYFDTACRRIEAAQRQADLFVPSAPQPEARTPDMFAEIAE